jgi:tRNA 5-methylaminomethyl-2-thiouridine biosynthesis bifunctional protein
MLESASQPLLQGCGLPQAWRDQSAWRVLDTDFHQGLRFLDTWQTWRSDAKRPRLLHYVALCEHPPSVDAILQAAALSSASSELHSLAQELAHECQGLGTGFQRISLDEGRVLLTLCVGETQALLREQQFAADCVVWDSPESGPASSRWALKALARCCRRGTRLVTAQAPSTTQAAWLLQTGFETAHNGVSNQWTYNPTWTLKTTRHPDLARALQAPPASDCVVIGAGLAGASVAAALARRGWQVQVLDAASAPAAGASSLPVGLVVPHVSADDNPRSQLSRSGIRMSLQQANNLLTSGQDWALSGVLEHRELGVSTLWHAQAGWIKPAQLVQAWLAQPGVRFVPNATVARLRREAEVWVLHNAAGQVLASAKHVIFANAWGAQALLDDLRMTAPELAPSLARLPALQGIRGVMSSGLQGPEQASALPALPVNGLGSLICNIPMGGESENAAGHMAWYAGATYETGELINAPLSAHHQTNFNKLRTLLPDAAQALSPAFDTGEVQTWQGTRCVTPDRLPVVGPLEASASPRLWISAALGSRGLSYAVLCAELLAAQMGGEPWPLPASLARHLSALRSHESKGESAMG